VNDNGATGNCIPAPGQPANNNGACPRETKFTIRVQSAGSGSITGPASIGATAGIGLFLIGGVIAGVMIVRKMKDKKKNGWVEFDEETFNDTAGINPLYEQRSRSQSNPIYVSSRESMELEQI